MKTSLLYASIVAAITTPLVFATPPAHSNKVEDKAHVVAGYAWTNYGPGYWSHTFDVVQKPDGWVSGIVEAYLFEHGPEGESDFILSYTIEVDCVSFDLETGTAWVGGYLIDSNHQEFLPLGLYMVVYAHDGGPGEKADTHGDNVPAWVGGSDTCTERLDPYVADPVHKGNIVIK